MTDFIFMFECLEARYKDCVHRKVGICTLKKPFPAWEIEKAYGKIQVIYCTDYITKQQTLLPYLEVINNE